MPIYLETLGIFLNFFNIFTGVLLIFCTYFKFIKTALIICCLWTIIATPLFIYFMFNIRDYL